MVTYYFISHFNLWGEVILLWSHPRWHFSNPFFSVSLLHHYLSLSPSSFLPSCHIPPFDAQTHFWVKEHHLDLGFIFLQHHYISSCLSFYNGFHNGPEGPQYLRIRQGDIRHDPKTRTIAPIKVLNHLGLGTSPWTGHQDSIPSRLVQGHGQAFVVSLVIISTLFEAEWCSLANRLGL
jgi:hypothetical protein